MDLISHPRDLDILPGLWNQHTDEQLRREFLERVRKRSWDLRPPRIRVDVSRGVIHLRGVVRSFYLRQILLEAAVDGAHEVIDELKVEPGPLVAERSDWHERYLGND